MIKILHILLIVLISVLSVSCQSDMTESDSKQKLVSIFNEAESTIRNPGNYPRALDLYLTFIHGAENEATLERLLMTAYISVAVIYGSFNDIDNAIIYNQQAYSLAKKLGDTKIAELALTNLAESYLARQEYDKASDTADSFKQLNVSDSHTLVFHQSLIKAEIAMQTGNHEEALFNIRLADSAAHAFELTPYEQSAPFELMARYFEKVNVPDSQLVYLNRVWDLVNAGTDPQPKAECARLLMQFHTGHGNIEAARQFQETYLQLTDSLVNMRQFLSVSAQHQQNQINSKGNIINYLQREVFYHRTIIAIIATLLTLAIVFIIIIVRQKRNLDLAYSALFDKSQRLLTLTSEQHISRNVAEKKNTSNDTVTTVAGEQKATGDEEARNRALYDKIVGLMENNFEYLNPDFGLSNLVSMADSNVAYVSKVIKLYADMNVPSFINRYRVREACRRILDEAAFGNITFAAIGESVGFNSQVSFNRAFKKVTGMPPSVYQKMATANRRPNL